MIHNSTFKLTPSELAREAYFEYTIRYLNEPTPQARELLVEKMKDYDRHSDILLHFEKLQKQLHKMEQSYESAWEAFANEAERRWFFDSYPELKEMFFQAAHKRGLAQKKWVICSS